ncbi:MAG: O-antigen ligase family protein [Thermoanaerobaculia bacterium]
MTGAAVFWEYGKYATAAIFLVALLRHRRRRPSGAMLLYFALLVPSTALTVAALDLSAARSAISFNLSGPFVLAVSAWFFLQLTLSGTQVARLLTTTMAPIVAVSVVVLFGIVTKESLRFGRESSLVTSGDFGPNQVSAVLGLGSLLAFFCAQDVALGRMVRAVMLAFCLVFAAQSALTFSRGGLYLAAGGALAAVFYLAREARARVRAVGIVVLCFFVAAYLVLPWLDSFTGGAISLRFADTGVTHRDEIARSDLQIWMEYPVLGVGPGLSRSHRESLIRGIAHTEFSRLLAEHGILGLAALILLLASGARNVRRQRSAPAKAVVAATVVWSFLFMAAAAMRLVAPSFLFAAGFANTLSRSPRLLRRGLRNGGRLIAVGRPLVGQ